MLTRLAASSTTYKTRQSPTRIRQWSLYPLSFLHPDGRGFSPSARILRSIRANSASSSASSSFAADGFISSEYLATLMIALQSFGAVFIIGNPLFFAARFGHQAIPKVLPNRFVLLEVDLDGDLATLRISDELDSGHGVIHLFQVCVMKSLHEPATDCPASAQALLDLFQCPA